MKTLNIELLRRLWSAVSDKELHVEVDTDPGGPEGFGPEVWLDATVAVWPSEIEVVGTPSITNPDPGPRKVVGWHVSRMVPEYNYPHAPDSVDYEDGTSHEGETDALFTAIALVVETRLVNALDAMADEEAARAYEESLFDADHVVESYLGQDFMAPSEEG
jgi:hypothetical protein